MKIKLSILLGLLLISAGTLAAPKVLYTFDSKTPPGNIAATQDGRIFISTHHFYGAKNKILEVKKATTHKRWFYTI